MHACHHPWWVAHPRCWHLSHVCKLASRLEELQDNFNQNSGQTLAGYFSHLVHSRRQIG